jgi:hypothetical protein
MPNTIFFFSFTQTSAGDVLAVDIVLPDACVQFYVTLYRQSAVNKTSNTAYPEATLHVC